MSNIFLYNSLTKKKEKFEPINPPKVGMYTCGFTVYDYAHIGSGRKYVMDDLLKRVLTYNGYTVNHVQNVTDVGHLVSDGDEGEDKLEKGAKKYGKDPFEIARFFENYFYESMDKLNVIRPNIICRATEHIQEQIAMIQRLVDKGFAYDTPEAVYFDSLKFHGYGEMFGQKLDEKRTERSDVVKGKYQKSPYDFVLWFKRVGAHKNHVMHWDSPWGDGFPGWHIECSAMSMKYLGEQFDIHTGGEDHLSVHHPNEIAQSEAVSGKSPFVRYWVHHAFLMIEGKKMSKSLGNLFTVDDVIKKGFEPLALRYLYLTAHYKDPLNFTWEALSSAQNALNNLRSQIWAARNQKQRTVLSVEKDIKREEFSNRFRNAVNNDLAVPKALAVLWEALKSNIPSEDKYDLALEFDQVLGLRLSDIREDKETEIPDKVLDLLAKREQLRKLKNFSDADEIRQEIEKEGYVVSDTNEGTIIKKVN